MILKKFAWVLFLIDYTLDCNGSLGIVSNDEPPNQLTLSLSNFLFWLLFAQFRAIDHSAEQGTEVAIGEFGWMSHEVFNWNLHGPHTVQSKWIASLENSYLNRSTVGLVNASMYLFKLIDVQWPLNHIWTLEPQLKCINDSELYSIINLKQESSI